jgi:hypothetical protein
MKRIVIAAAMSLCVVSLADVSSADTLIMRDGTRIEGTVVGIVERTITFRRTDGSSRHYQTSQVEALEFLSPEPRYSRGFGGGGLVVPAGSELLVRTVESIDSRNADVDQLFSALVEEEVIDGSDRVIVPEGSSAQLIIRHVSSGGQTGSPEMVLDVRSIVVDGRRYMVSTTDLALDNDRGIGRNRRTAQATGGGAVLGTIIGAIAGGGKGAAIGALIGAGAGASAQVLTRGRDVRVPAETVLRFRLDRSVMLQPEQ